MSAVAHSELANWDGGLSPTSGGKTSDVNPTASGSTNSSLRAHFAASPSNGAFQNVSGNDCQPRSHEQLVSTPIIHSGTPHIPGMKESPMHSMEMGKARVHSEVAVSTSSERLEMAQGASGEVSNVRGERRFGRRSDK